MTEISELVEHNQGAVFAVDPSSRVVAWNGGAEAGLGLPASRVLGRPCYQVTMAVDDDTGRPCYERCALVNPAVRAGWVHSRVLRAPWLDGEPAKLDCMLVHYVLPSAERGSLSFITPLSSEAAADSVQRVSAIEALSPVLAGPGDVLSATRQALDIVLQATAADLVELSLVNLEVNGLPDRVSRMRQDVDAARHAGSTRPGKVSGAAASELTSRQPESENEPSMAYALDRERMYELVRSHEGALVTREPEGSRGATWFVTIPLFAERSLLAMLTVSSRRPDFSLSSAVRGCSSSAARSVCSFDGRERALGTASPPAGVVPCSSCTVSATSVSFCTARRCPNRGSGVTNPWCCSRLWPLVAVNPGTARS